MSNRNRYSDLTETLNRTLRKQPIQTISRFRNTNNKRKDEENKRERERERERKTWREKR
ncbi:hypothetical protein Hanom_Chr06g00487281 [Helianthus anomalus]